MTGSPGDSWKQDEFSLQQCTADPSWVQALVCDLGARSECVPRACAPGAHVTERRTPANLTGQTADQCGVSLLGETQSMGVVLKTTGRI